MYESPGTSQDARPGSDSADSVVWDTDIVRRNFRSVLRWIVALTALFCIVHASIFLRLGDPHWRWPAAVVVVCLIVSTTIRPRDSFARLLVGLMIFIGATSWTMSALVLAFGRDSGFHFPFLVGLPLIAISGRIGLASKIALSVAYAGALLTLDRMSASTPVAEVLGAWHGEWIRLLNIGFVAIAISGVIIRYFRIIVRQKAELLALSTTDPLTGLLNRRHLIEVAGAQTSAARRHGRPVSLIICDIDDFKRINDHYGHEVGDAVIRHVAGVIGQTLRSSDHLGRWGGEEFVILLPDTAREDALNVAERVCGTIASAPAKVGALVLEVTATAGVATLFRAESFEDGLRRADAALYVGKATGKNRVVDADPESANVPAVDRSP